MTTPVRFGDTELPGEQRHSLRRAIREGLGHEIDALDWKLQDVVVAPVQTLPSHLRH